MFSTPAVVGDVVCVGSCKGMFYALDRATGQSRGQHDVFSADSIHRQFHGDALLDDGLLLIGTDTSEGNTAYVFALEPRTAGMRWRQPMGSGVMGDIARWKDRRYAATVMDELVCQAATGRQLWRSPQISPLTYGLADGAVRWTHALQGVVRGIGTAGDTLYVGTLKGHVYALVHER